MHKAIARQQEQELACQGVSSLLRKMPVFYSDTVSSDYLSVPVALVAEKQRGVTIRGESMRISVASHL